MEIRPFARRFSNDSGRWTFLEIARHDFFGQLTQLGVALREWLAFVRGCGRTTESQPHHELAARRMDHERIKPAREGLGGFAKLRVNTAAARFIQKNAGSV